jgi:SAM-dependent methyltransferase
MVASTEKRLKKAGLKAEKISIDSVLAIPYPDETFDTVCCLAVIDHLPDDKSHKAAVELARVLKPGGKLYINTPNRFAYHWRAGHFLMRQIGLFPKGEIRLYKPNDLKNLPQNSGLVPGRRLWLEFIPLFSGLYTSDLRRYTFLPQRLISLLDRLYLGIEIRLRRIEIIKPACLHYFLEATKPINE